MEEQHLVVLYDIQIDRIRTKISEACLDYGLERIQYSAFQGKLTRNKREELWLRLKTILEDHAGKILVQPICEKDHRASQSIEIEGGTEATAPAMQPHPNEEGTERFARKT